MQTARVYRVHGRVQGVGFRWFVQDAAAELGVTGYVKNLHDGDVEVYAVGSEDDQKELRRKLEEGPPGARVLSVHEQPAPARRYETFQVEY